MLRRLHARFVAWWTLGDEPTGRERVALDALARIDALQRHPSSRPPRSAP